MQKISKLTLKNFKFFYGEVPLDFERKNVLIYGENGSGKSSIYWALYTFLQSVSKTDVRQIEKYFDYRHEQNLVNRFASDGSDCGIVVEFVDDNNFKTTNEISNKTINTHVGTIVKEAAQASDFITYKLLAKIYDFKNSTDIDLFDLFEDEILMFINFRENLARHDGTNGSANAFDWWKYISTGLDPRPKMHEQPYKTFVAAVNKFNDELEFYLNKITESVNEYLSRFKQDIKLSFEYEKAEYDRFKEGSTKVRTHETANPKILLDIQFNHDSLDEHKKRILRPQSFLNEARLTTIALSIRLAVFDEKLQTDGLTADAPKILILDDLLLSLDMGNRDVVLELIVNEFKNVQILIMTHDKSFFNLTKRRIELENHEKDWIYRELYQGETETGIPQPCIPDNSDYLSLARKYLKEFDYPASANYLRKETERILKHLLPPCKTVYVKDDEGTKPLKLDTQIENFKQHYKLFCKDDAEFKQDFLQFKKLKEHKDLLLNPLSHDNIDTPIYKQELLSIISLLDSLKMLDYKLLVSIKDQPEVFVFLTENDAAGEDWSYKIRLKEHLRAFKKLDGTWVLSNPQCEVITRRKLSDGTVEAISDVNKLRKIYDRARFGLGIKNTQPEKDLFDIIFTQDNKKLSEILNS
jgi:predicted ATP-binding protein involved in virulence